MASGPYQTTLLKALEAYYEAGTWYAMLLTGHTEDRDTHDFKSDVVANEIANGNGYTTGGLAVSAPTVTYNSTTNLFTVTFQQAQWTSATISATHCIWYKELGADSVDELGYVNNFGGTVTSTNDNFTVPASNFTIDFPDTD